MQSPLFLIACAFFAGTTTHGDAQEKSVRPGINDTFKNPNVKDFVERFEIESREVFLKREDILGACGLKGGETLADIGAGTGLFTRMFSKAVGSQGRVIAVDISQNFLDHIQICSSGSSDVDHNRFDQCRNGKFLDLFGHSC
jgi:cyclopropane fatty-acyl-phospholipid synthase-like methyltransferase